MKENKCFIEMIYSRLCYIRVSTSMFAVILIVYYSMMINDK